MYAEFKSLSLNAVNGDCIQQCSATLKLKGIQLDMCKFIKIETLVANALIELIEKNNCRSVEFARIMEYGRAVFEALQAKGEEAVYLASRDDTSKMMRNYADFFEINRNSLDTVMVGLRDGKTAADLRSQFRAFLTLEHLFAFTNSRALVELGIGMVDAIGELGCCPT